MTPGRVSEDCDYAPLIKLIARFQVMEKVNKNTMHFLIY